MTAVVPAGMDAAICHSSGPPRAVASAIMHREQKIGLGLGVLLVGVVGAFFFRNDSRPDEPLPRLAETTLADERIAERPVMPYLTGLEPVPGTRETSPPPAEPARAVADDPFSLPPPPEPISTAPASTPATTPVAARDLQGAPPAEAPGAGVPPIPAHNNAWQPRASRRAEAGAAKVVSTDGGTVYHIVEKGDTLSGIAARYLGSSGRFLELYRYNQDVLADPHALQVGMKLRIPPARRGDAPRPAGGDGPAPPADVPTAETRPAARPISATQPASPAADAGATSRWAAEDRTEPAGTQPEAAPSPDAPARPLRFVPVPHSPLNPGPRRLSQVPPDDLP